MAKSPEKTKKTVSAKESTETAKSQTKIGDYAGCLLELHKLQGVLLTQLLKEIKSF